MTGRSSTVTGQGDGSATGQVEAALPFQDAAAEQRDLRFIWRFQPKPPPCSARLTSALSTPANFIAESPIKRTIHRLFSHRTWPPVAAGLAVLVALAAIPVGLWLADSPEVAETAEWGREPSLAREQAATDASTSTGSGTAEALTGTARLLAIEPGSAAEGSPSALREEPPRSFAELADSGPEQPPALFAFASPSTRITAFPPMLAPGAAPVKSGAAAEQPEPARTVAKLRPDPRRLDALIERGNQLLSQGEIAGARLFFERAVAQDDPRGALGLARSYDPLVLKGLAVAGLSGNDAEAERWYRKAHELEAVMDLLRVVRRF